MVLLALVWTRAARRRDGIGPAPDGSSASFVAPAVTTVGATITPATETAAGAFLAGASLADSDGLVDELLAVECAD